MLPMVFVESRRFAEWRDAFLSDELFAALLAGLVSNPVAGDVIPGGHGLRKLRIRLPGRGKRGGARVIYFNWVERERIYLLYGYAKNRQADLTTAQLQRLVALMNEDLSDG